MYEVDKYEIQLYQLPFCDEDEDDDFRKQTEELRVSLPLLSCFYDLIRRNYVDVVTLFLVQHAFRRGWQQRYGGSPGKKSSCTTLSMGNSGR